MDYKSWNGVLLADNKGAAFAVRLRYVIDGHLVTQDELYDSIDEVGPRASDSIYANVASKMIDLKWSAGEYTIYGKVTAKQDMEIIIEAYRPYPEAGKYYVEGNNILGSSPEVLRDAGVSQITGGYAMIWSRSSFAKDFDGDSTFFCASISKKPDELYKVVDNKLVSVSNIEKTEPVETIALGYSVLRNDCIYLECIISSKELVLPFLSFAEIESKINESRERHESLRFDGQGGIAKVARPMNDMLYWLTTYHPYYKYNWITLGRPWQSDGRWNVWGWDECFAAIVSALESPELAENCIRIAYQDERV